MTVQTSMSLEEAADRRAIRELIDAYAHCADRRDAKGQMALFTTNTVFKVYMDSRSTEPTQTLRGRDALAPVFENLNTYLPGHDPLERPRYSKNRREHGEG
jgi:SnoaL-like domain